MNNQQVTMSDFTSPEQARDQLQARLDYAAGKMIAAGCANSLIIVTPASIDEKTRSVHPGDLQYSKDHCQNDRRNGSKYCQVCSDKHHGISTS